MEPRKLDPRHTGELLKHMDKQNEVLMETYREMMHELQQLQVEHEVLMCKLYETMSAHGLVKKNDDGNSGASYDSRADLSNKEDNEENDKQ